MIRSQACHMSQASHARNLKAVDKLVDGVLVQYRTTKEGIKAPSGFEPGKVPQHLAANFRPVLYNQTHSTPIGEGAQTLMT